MNLVEMERKEVQRREEELRQRKDLLEEKKRKHAKIENDIIEQVTFSHRFNMLVFRDIKIFNIIHSINAMKRDHHILIAEANFD